jgi:SAM-dependent methyltransferase
MLRKLLGPVFRLRPLGLLAETWFWWRWVRTRGLQWPEEFARRLDPRSPLLQEVAERVRRITTDPVRILDVGAGPATCLGYLMEGRRVEITAVDVLAGVYDLLWARSGIVPPVRTLRADAERLTERFAAGSFDIVYAQNSLDHAARPRAAIEQMVRMAKPGGFVLLSHAIDEGKNEDYAGLHRWNLSERAGDFVIWNPAESVNMTEALRGECATSTTAKGGSVFVEMHKKR